MRGPSCLIGSRGHMTCFIPQSDDWMREAAFLPDCAKTGRIQHERPRVGGRLKADPTRSQHPNEMSAGKKQHISFNGAHAAHYSVCPCAYLSGRFSSRATMDEQLPVGAFGQDVHCASALVCAVVPFHQVGIHIGHRSEASEFTSSPRALQWMGKYLYERKSL
jgi:hypothetical protein